MLTLAKARRTLEAAVVEAHAIILLLQAWAENQVVKDHIEQDPDDGVCEHDEVLDQRRCRVRSDRIVESVTHHGSKHPDQSCGLDQNALLRCHRISVIGAKDA